MVLRGGAAAGGVWGPRGPPHRNPPRARAVLVGPARRNAGARRALRASARRTSRPRPGVPPARLRGPHPLPREGAPATGERRPARQPARRSRGAGASRRGLRARPRHAAGSRAAAGAWTDGLDERALDVPERVTLPRPRRLSAGAPAAARPAALASA